MIRVRRQLRPDGDVWLMHGDCLELMQQLPDDSIDLILCDLPYGLTANKWDEIIPFAKLWEQYKRICSGRVVLTASQPFTSALVMSNPKAFRHSWTWLKKGATGFQLSKKMPLRATEDVLVFCPGPYYPQGLVKLNAAKKNGGNGAGGGSSLHGDGYKNIVRDHHYRNLGGKIGQGKMCTPGLQFTQEFTNYPKNILHYGYDGPRLHPTQKPVAMLEYLIRTYSEPGDTILDNCMGSGTTGVACIHTGRKFIGMELGDENFRIATEQLATAHKKHRLFDEE